MPRNIKEFSLFVYDFDGVMTNNTAIIDQDGKESVIVNRGDGLGITIIKKHNIEQLILSTESNDVVLARADKLKIPVIHDCQNKKEMLKKYCRKHKIKLKKVLYIGNDINDIEVMKKVGYKVCPADAHSSVRSIADLVTSSKGGEGVIRELIDLIEGINQI